MGTIILLASLLALPGDTAYRQWRAIRLDRSKVEVVNALPGLYRMGETRQASWDPQVLKERSRGISTDLYPRVAPAVVVIKLPESHGTGFFFHPDGWILTNRHVVEDAFPDPESGFPTVEVLAGKLEEGWMKLSPARLKARVCRSDDRLDLGLLRLIDPLPDKKPPAVLRLSEKPPVAGSDCVAIGHPGSVALWSVRSGQITSQVKWPEELVENIMRLVSLPEADARRFEELLKGSPGRRVLLTDVGVDAGDSGGPLVNSSGELVGVTFGMPRLSSQGRQGTTSYHVHVDEVRAFVKDLPKELELAVDPWPSEAYMALVDVDGDGVDDLLAFSPTRGEGPTAFLLDLDQDSPKDLKIEDLKEARGRQRWDFEFALRLRPWPSAYYDTDGQGGIDLAAFDAGGDEKAETVLRLQGGKWRAVREPGLALADSANFKHEGLQRRFQELTGKLSSR